MTGAMREAMRDWWWLVVGGVAVMLAVALIATVGVVDTCADLFYGTSVPSVSPCQDRMDAAQRTWIVGTVLLLIGLATVAYGVGYRRGRRVRQRVEADAQATP